MATASSRTESSNNHGGSSQLHAIVSCAKLKRKKSLFGTAIYVEVTAEGESRRTAKSHSSSNPKWDERLTLNVTPHTLVDFKVWSHHTLKADALLGKATLDLLQALEQHDRRLENVKEVLKLSVEQKGAPVATGELTVYLDGLTVTDREPLAPLTNGNTTNTTTKVQQNGDAIHENGGDSSSSSSRAASSTVNGTGSGPSHGSGSRLAPNIVDSQVPSTPSTSPSPGPVVNGDATPTHQSLDGDLVTVNGESFDAAPSFFSATQDHTAPPADGHEDCSQATTLPDSAPVADSTIPAPSTTVTTSSSSSASAPAPASSSAAESNDSAPAAPSPTAQVATTTTTTTSSSSSSSPAPGEAAASGAGGADAGNSDGAAVSDGAKPRQQAPNAGSADALPPG